MLTRFNSTRAESVNDRTFKFVISDESVDRYGTVIKLDGWDLSNYSKNGIVAYQHNTYSDNPDMIVGKGRAWVENGVLMGEVELEPEGTNPIADKLATKLAFGSINSTSVGFNPSVWSYGNKEQGEDPKILYFRKQDLLEWSIVNIPANANAVQQKSLDEFVKMVQSETPQEETTQQNIETKGIDPDVTEFFRLRLKMNTL